MKKVYVSPEAVKVNFEANDIITVSGALKVGGTYDSTNTYGAMSILWDELAGE